MATIKERLTSRKHEFRFLFDPKEEVRKLLNKPRRGLRRRRLFKKGAKVEA